MGASNYNLREKSRDDARTRQIAAISMISEAIKLLLAMRDPKVNRFTSEDSCLLGQVRTSLDLDIGNDESLTITFYRKTTNVQSHDLG